VQDTGWAAHLPSGDGLLAFTTPEEALAGIDRINSDYPAHARRAAEIAREHFDATRVLPALLDEACA
jgi:L-rhamnose isomerase